MDLGLARSGVIVTGGSKGIGRAAALAFAREGARVAIGARSLEQLDEAREQILAQTGAQVLAVRVDTTRELEVADFIARCMEALGRCDVLVNAAASAKAGAFMDLNEAGWQDSMDAKYFGYIRVARALVPHMIKQGGGRIVNVIGVGGREYLPSNIAGSAANAALYLLTKGMAHELAAYGILVNAVSPGHVDTERWRTVVEGTARVRGLAKDEAEAALLQTVPLRRVGRAEEVADAIVFLASTKASYITGSCLAIDGGRMRSF